VGRRKRVTREVAEHVSESTLQKRICSTGGPVDGEWEEGRKKTRTQYELIIMMQQLIVLSDCNDPTASSVFPSFFT